MGGIYRVPHTIPGGSTNRRDNSRDVLLFMFFSPFLLYFRRAAHRTQSTGTPRKQPPEMQKAVLSVCNSTPPDKIRAKHTKRPT